jgi:hypothetical protein
MVTKPREVGWAISLELAAIALGPVAITLDWKHLNSIAPIPRLVLVQVIAISLIGYLTWKISQGTNWARITLLVLFLLGLPSFFIYLRADFARSLALGVVMVLETLMEGAALWILFIAPASDWFTTPTKVRLSSNPD